MPQSAKAYGFNENSEAFIGTPTTMAGTTIGGFTDFPFVPAPRVDGTGVYYVDSESNPAAGDRLDLLDTSTEMFTRAVYTFQELVHRVRDMRVVRIPGLP